MTEWLKPLPPPPHAMAVQKEHSSIFTCSLTVSQSQEVKSNLSLPQLYDELDQELFATLAYDNHYFRFCIVFDVLIHLLQDNVEMKHK